MIRRSVVPWAAALVVLAACTELRVASDGSSTQDDDEEVAEDGEDGDPGGPRDASAKPDVVVAPADAGDGGGADGCDGYCPPELLVDGLSQATTLTVDDANVYFAVESGNGTVYQCPKTGCKGAPIELGEGYARSIVVSNGVVYWGDFSGGKVQSCAVGGCGRSPAAVALNQPSIQGVVTDGVDLFWASGGAIKRCRIGACSTASVSEVTSGQGSVLSLAADQGKVFWATGGEVRACAAAGCSSPTKLGPGTSGVSARAGTVFWTTGGTAKTVVSCSASGCGSAPLTIGSSPSPMSPVSDGKHVYWRDDRPYGYIMRCPTAGCSPGPEILAEKQGGQPGAAIAVDADHVYWTTTKAVFRLRK